jgi:hypothetical protein
VKAALQPDETILHETGANIGRAPASVRGTLTLTDQRLVFEPKEIRSANDGITIRVQDIGSAARVYLPGPFGRNNVRSLQVTHRNGVVETFMVTRPMRWVKALELVGVSSG